MLRNHYQKHLLLSNLVYVHSKTKKRTHNYPKISKEIQKSDTSHAWSVRFFWVWEYVIRYEKKTITINSDYPVQISLVLTTATVPCEQKSLAVLFIPHKKIGIFLLNHSHYFLSPYLSKTQYVVSRNKNRSICCVFAFLWTHCKKVILSVFIPCVFFWYGNHW